VVVAAVVAVKMPALALLVVAALVVVAAEAMVPTMQLQILVAQAQQAQHLVLKVPWHKPQIQLMVPHY
jgi:hypothetical protein